MDPVGASSSSVWTKEGKKVADFPLPSFPSHVGEGMKSRNSLNFP